MPIDMIGWVATAIFVCSYLFQGPKTLRRIQTLAAGLWVVYGLFIQAAPVVVANLLVAVMALYSSFSAPRKLVLPAAKTNSGPKPG
jgi:uncharacterized protein with PQ loop repeat